MKDLKEKTQPKSPPAWRVALAIACWLAVLGPEIVAAGVVGNIMILLLGGSAICFVVGGLGILRSIGEILRGE